MFSSDAYSCIGRKCLNSNGEIGVPRVKTGAGTTWCRICHRHPPTTSKIPPLLGRKVHAHVPKYLLIVQDNLLAHLAEYIFISGSVGDKIRMKVCIVLIDYC